MSSNKILVSLHWPSPPEWLRAPPKAIIRTWCQNQNTTLCQVNKCPLNLEGWRWDTSGSSSWWLGRWILVLHDKLPRYLSLLVSMLKLSALTTAVEIFDFRWAKTMLHKKLRRVSYMCYGYQASWEKDVLYLHLSISKIKFFCVCAEYASIFVVVGTGWAEDLKRNGGILNLPTDFFWMVFEYVLTDSKLRKHPHHHFTTLHWCCTGMRGDKKG